MFSALLLIASLGLKWGLPASNTTQRAFPFMLLLSLIGLVASLWLWFFQKRRANAATAIFVLANMAAVAAMVLPFALATKADRRANDPKGPPPDPAAAAKAEQSAAPTPWAGLGYLPEDCNLVAGIQIAELMAQPVGAKLLRHDPADAEPRPALIELAVGQVEKLTGLKLEMLDHLVMGTRIDHGLPHLMLAVRTRKPYDPAVVAKAQAPTVAVKHQGRDLYQFNLKPVGTGMLFEADPQTLVLVLRVDAVAERDKQALVTTPRSAAGPAPLRSLRLWRSAWMPQIWWTAKEIERPEIASILLPIAPKGPNLAKLLTGVKNVTIQLALQQDALLVGHVGFGDVENARHFMSWITKQSIDGLGSPLPHDPYPGMPRDELLPSPVAEFELFGSPEAVLATLRSVRLLAPRFGKE